ncbi:MAG: DNA primase [Endozoicomonadaceae bacterium]|nr:DNA primase [Endozoicomonadaceae bacterium]
MNKLIPQVFINDILARTDIVELISESLPLKKTGQNYSACCPFHQEKTPSFHVQKEKQFYYCFGCGVSGNVVSFLMNYQEMSFPAAIEYLAKQHGLDIPKEKPHTSKIMQEKLMRLYAIAQKATIFYEKQYAEKQNIVAKQYLENRGISSDMMKTFKIGYAPNAWNLLYDALLPQGYTKEQLKDSGLFAQGENKQNLYDRFRHRIIFPIRNMQGQVTSFGGRILDHQNPKYLNSSETLIFQKSQTLYGLYEAKQKNKTLNMLMIVEGYMDVIALYQHGITQVVATLGTAITVEHIQKIFKYAHHVIFCYDADTAGKNAAWKALQHSLPALKDGYRVQFLFLPEGEDPDSFIFKKGIDAFKTYMNKKSLALDEYLFQNIIESVDINTLEGKAEFLQLSKNYIQKIPTGAYQTLITQEMTKYTGLSMGMIQNLLDSSSKMHPVKETEDQQYQNTHLKHQSAISQPIYTYNIPKIKASLVHRIIKILLYYPHLIADINAHVIQKLQQDTRQNTQLLITLIQFMQTTTCHNVSMIQGSWYNTPLGQLLIEAQLLELPNLNKKDDLNHIINQLIEKIYQDKLASSPTRDKLHLLRELATMRPTP